MENLYGFVFWHNYLNSTWYAIPRDQYSTFFGGNVNAEGVLKSGDIKTLISIIENPALIKDL
jgi:hypothetical protein